MLTYKKSHKLYEDMLLQADKQVRSLLANNIHKDIMQFVVSKETLTFLEDWYTYFFIKFEPLGFKWKYTLFGVHIEVKEGLAFGMVLLTIKDTVIKEVDDEIHKNK